MALPSQSVPCSSQAADLRAAVRISRTGQPGQPAPRGPADLRPVPLRFRQRRARRRGEGTVRDLRRAASGLPLFQATAANLNPWTEAKVNTGNPDRGPMLLISGEKDHTVPWAITNASYKHQSHNTGVTEIVEMPNRGHALTIHSDWREVANTALAFTQRFTNLQPAGVGTATS